GRRCLPHLLHVCARTRRPLGHVSVARPRSQGAQRRGRLVAAPRRVRPVLRNCGYDTPEREIAYGFRASFSAGLVQFLHHVSAALCYKRGADHPLVCVHVIHEHVDDMDADAWTDMAYRRGVVPGDVDRDDDGDDAAIFVAHASAIPPWSCQDTSNTPDPADCARGGGVLLGLDWLRNS